ncbi:PAS domain S-box-containing protein/diguanylate cyclase (GGDEF) domain-containing protein [Pseudomonas sp. URIL14HWK12:I9]|nr:MULTISPECIES: EAL domain-containing protein [unclassified Pseudomonas]PVZ10494.1 PAS domain S-box-containing protein/diguanylate cyclase (GGDEF)-like protein [Pseudomonas sp. URIL14HWK12:I12]PVZ21920.1 PAS domain S-box-containing protein/diguanylate cyclase (GGDEF)-like protein [Pseudomonas sp. URIL14HWK12:I10]PVZ30997.1 PAS domain S-box-containing protein/diguanylate cyclase (GGDEF)-like protein [Pseudomonas sp. URIL14HWK12:I11]SNZ17512.1 PAS domain S-box-containing protein/diguanylate cycl
MPMNEATGSFEPLHPLPGDFSAQLAAERTRLLYQGSLLPTLLMLLVGMLCTWLSWLPGNHLLVSAWLVWLMALIALRVILMAAFDSALPSDQASPRWLRRFLLGAFASGLTLGIAAIALTPQDNFIQQAWIFGLLGAAALSASIAYAVSINAFLAFVLPCLGPPIVYLLAFGGLHERGWGWLGLMLLVSLCLVAWQVHRLIRRGLLRRFQNQALIESLQQEQVAISRLNQELALEMERRSQTQGQLHQAHATLEQRVQERSRALDSAHQALSKSEARLAMALEASELGLWDWNLRTDEVHHTHLQGLFGLADDTSARVLEHLKPRLHPDDLPVLRRALVSHMKGRTDAYRVEYRIRHSDGRWLWIEDRGRAVERDSNGRVVRMLGTRRDVSARREQEEQQQLAASVFGAISEGIAVLGPDFHLQALNQAFTRITGYTARDCEGAPFHDWPCSHDTRRHWPQIEQAMANCGSWQGEVVEARASGELYPQWLQLSAVRDERGHTRKIIAFVSDLSSRRASEERLYYLTHHDELTGLGNRSLFRQRLYEAVQALRQGGRSLALLHIDLDRFKLLNDSFGHDQADEVLRQMARRISAALPEANTIARLGADEFVVLFDAYSHLSSLIRVTTRLLAKLRAPLLLGDREVTLGASIGISLLPDNTRDLNELMSQAELAMQAAKRLGGDNLQFYTESLQADAHQRLQLEHQLRKALHAGQLDVYYQPKVRLGDSRIVGVEALVRWRHPERGLLLPGAFIDIAETTGQVVAIGEFVLRQACRQLCAWAGEGITDVTVAVNLSSQQLRQGNLVSLVRQALAEHGVSAKLLELELTESQWLQNLDDVRATFEQLRAMGVKVSIDDFGTGYSSLSYLKRLPVDYVKIDRSFIMELGQDGQDAAITQAIIDLAHALKLEVVAEGVETAEQRDILAQQGCDQVQGYLYGRPVPAPALGLHL